MGFRLKPGSVVRDCYSLNNSICECECVCWGECVCVCVQIRWAEPGEQLCCTHVCGCGRHVGSSIPRVKGTKNILRLTLTRLINAHQSAPILGFF